MGLGESKSSESNSTSNDDKVTGQRTVVIGVDGSRHSLRAFDWYANSPGVTEDKVIVHHCLELPGSILTTSGLLRESKENRQELKRLRERAEKLRALFDTKCAVKGLSCEFSVEEGSDPKQNVMETARRRQADLIVIGSRGYGLVAGQLLGSVSEYILHHSHIPILIVPPTTNHRKRAHHG